LIDKIKQIDWLITATEFNEIKEIICATGISYNYNRDDITKEVQEEWKTMFTLVKEVVVTF
jgi:hypothetical protein